MSRPASQAEAMRLARAFLANSQPGARGTTVAAHLNRAEMVADTIWRRFNVGPYQWQAKHLRWYLDRACANLAPTTRYDRWRTIRSLAVALGRLDGWQHHLRGPWLRPNGDGEAPLGTGRPPKLPGRGGAKR
jgi:hypothetical protein